MQILFIKVAEYLFLRVIWETAFGLAIEIVFHFHFISCQGIEGTNGHVQPPQGAPPTLPKAQHPISTQPGAVGPCPSDAEAGPVSSTPQPFPVRLWAMRHLDTKSLELVPFQVSFNMTIPLLQQWSLGDAAGEGTACL